MKMVTRVTVVHIEHRLDKEVDPTSNHMKTAAFWKDSPTGVDTRPAQGNIKLDSFNQPLKSAIDSITASKGGGSIALFKNSRMSPNFNNLIVRASSCSGVRRISGVACSANL